MLGFDAFSPIGGRSGLARRVPSLGGEHAGPDAALAPMERRRNERPSRDPSAPKASASVLPENRHPLRRWPTEADATDLAQPSAVAPGSATRGADDLQRVRALALRTGDAPGESPHGSGKGPLEGRRGRLDLPTSLRRNIGRFGTTVFGLSLESACQRPSRRSNIPLEQAFAIAVRQPQDLRTGS